MRIFCNASGLASVFKDEAQKAMPVLIFLCLLALPLKSGAEERTFGNGTLSEFLALYDVDNSGGLSTEELQALSRDRKDRRARLRSRWDLDNDGRISDREREAAKAAIQRQIEARRSLRFDEVDSDLDGFLSKGEFDAIAAVDAANEARPRISDALYTNLDSDGDGRVSKREFLRKLDSIPTMLDPTRLPKPHPKERDVAPAPRR